MYCYWHPSAAIYIGIAHTIQDHRKNKLIARECPGCFVFPFEEAANFCMRFLELEQFSLWKGKASFGHFWVFALYTDDSSWRPYGSGDSEILSQPTPASALMMPRCWAATEGRLTQHPPGTSFAQISAVPQGSGNVEEVNFIWRASVSFNYADNLLKERGSKVRCLHYQTTLSAC